jgi:hypothetical protein
VSFRIPMFCADEWKDPHHILVNNDGTLTLEDHDVELELALIALGAQTPRCIQGYLNYQKNFLGLLNEIGHVLPPPPRDASYYRESLPVCGLLAVDFITHALTHKPPMEASVLAPYNTALQAANDGFRWHLNRAMTLPRTYDLAAKAPACQKSARIRFHTYVREFDRLLPDNVMLSTSTAADMLQRLSPMVMTRIPLRQCFELLEAIAHDGQRIASLTVRERDGAAQERLEARHNEAAWQRTHVVKALTAIAERRPWPSL